MSASSSRLGLLGLSLLLVACKSDPTSLRATLRFDDAAHAVDQLVVNVSTPARVLVTDRVLRADGRVLKSGDSFVVLLPDDLDGQTATVAVTASGGGGDTLTGSASGRIQRNSVTDLELPLDPGGTDGGADGDLADLAMPDLAMPDLAEGDIDNDMPDLTPPPDFTTDGGAGDLTAGGCSDPIVLTGGKVVSGSIGTYGDHTAGTCGGGGGRDVVGRLLVPDWQTVTFDTVGSAVDTILYARSACADPLTELPREGPCTGATAGPGLACSDDATGLGTASRLVLCGLPPAAYHAWLDSKAGQSGAFSLTTTVATADLNSCTGAGNLLGGGTYTASTVGHADRFAAAKIGGCMAGDRGATSPDTIFFLPLTATRNVTITTTTSFAHLVYVRTSCAGVDVACTNTGGMTSTLALMQQPPGLYFIIVDGIAGASGSIQITVTLS